jgi:hypothetical protein
MVFLGSQELLGALAVLIGLVDSFVYFRGIWRGETQPHAMTWGVWVIMLGSIFVAQAVEGGGAGSWLAAFDTIYAAVVFLYALRISSRQYIARSDWFMLAAALLAIVPWILTKNPLWSVILITIIDGFAYIPTIRKAYNHPNTEPILAYALAALKWIPAVFALSMFSVTTVLYPVFIILMSVGITAMLYIRRRQLASAHSI